MGILLGTQALGLTIEEPAIAVQADTKKIDAYVTNGDHNQSCHGDKSGLATLPASD